MWSLLLVYTVFLGALMSPGPDFLIVIRNALAYSARTGMFTALGIVAGNMVHYAYCLAGIGLLITHSAVLFNAVKWIGAAYLVYVGLQALRSKGITVQAVDEDLLTGNLRRAEKSDMQAFINGFVTNLFNPKAVLFFIALFTQMLDPGMPMHLLLVFCSICLVTAFTWFSVVALMMTARPVRQVYAGLSAWFDRMFGLFFIGLGIKLALLRL